MPAPEAGPFLDYGCGKGRVLMMAAEAGFREIIGVELSRQLCEQARQNWLRFVARFGRGARAAIVHEDAAVYAVPPAVSCVYLYNPFGEWIIEQVLDRIDESLKIRPRKLHLIYVAPYHADLLEGRGYARVHEISARRGLEACIFQRA